MEVDFTGDVFEWRGPAPFYYVAVPDDDSADIKEASAILKMASTRTVYAQKADEARATGRALGLPRWAVEIIPTLTPGIAVWDVNGNVQVVKHLVTEPERELVYTDRAMRRTAG